MSNVCIATCLQQLVSKISLFTRHSKQWSQKTSEHASHDNLYRVFVSWDLNMSSFVIREFVPSNTIIFDLDEQVRNIKKRSKRVSTRFKHVSSNLNNVSIHLNRFQNVSTMSHTVSRQFQTRLITFVKTNFKNPQPV